MLHRLLSELYEIPGYIYAVLAVATVTAWGVLIAYFRERRAFRVLCGMIAAVTVIGILCITVLFRSEQESGLILRPFAVFALAAQYSDVYNQMVLNVMLFVPLGMALPSVWPKRRKHPLVMTMLSGVSLSVLVEILQWLLSQFRRMIPLASAEGLVKVTGNTAQPVASTEYSFCVQSALQPSGSSRFSMPEIAWSP